MARSFVSWLASESPAALSMQAGDLLEEDVLAKIGTGLYIGNLWYVNFSDRMNCRLTGMTRFATFWVENGVIVHPVHEITIAGNLRDMFKGIAAIGGDVDRRGALHTGSVLIDDLTIAGE